MPNWGTEESQKRNHHPLRIYACQVCGKQFARRCEKPVLTCSKECFGKMVSRRRKGKCPDWLVHHRGRTAGWNKGLSWPPEVREKISANLRGRFLLDTPSHKTYRRYAIAKYGHKCQRCGWDKVPEVLMVHHRDGDRSNNSYENLEVLCPNCHAEVHRCRIEGKTAHAVQE